MIGSKERFFLQASERLPQAENLKARGSWDALSDDLQDGIAERKKNVVFEWQHPEIFARRDNQAFVYAIETFLHTAFYLKARNELDPGQESLLLITILVVPENERQFIMELLSADCLKVWNIRVEVVGYE